MVRLATKNNDPIVRAKAVRQLGLDALLNQGILLQIANEDIEISVRIEAIKLLINADYLVKISNDAGEHKAVRKAANQILKNIELKEKSNSKDMFKAASGSKAGNSKEYDHKQIEELLELAKFGATEEIRRLAKNELAQAKRNNPDVAERIPMKFSWKYRHRF